MSSKKSSWNKGQDILLENCDNRLFNHYSLLTKNRFLWQGLPRGVTSRHIEKGLFEHGQVCFINDEEVGHLCLPCTPTNNFNVYGDPLSLQVHGIAYSKQYNSENVVRILSNDNSSAMINTVLYYSKLIGELEKTCNINMLQQRFPFIISTTKDNELTMKNIVEKINKGELALFVDQKLSNGGDVGVKSLKTESPYLLDKLQAHKKDLECELLSLIGLNNSNNNKSERLLVDEVNINNGEVLMNLELEYINRKKACEQINEKFGLNISVEKTIDMLEVNFKGGVKKKEVN